MPEAHTESPPGKRPEQKARLADVAREARVSISTASRALRGESCVREEMAERVRKAAISVGYAPRVRDGTRGRAGAGPKATRQTRERVSVITPPAGTDGLALPRLFEGVALTLRGAALHFGAGPVVEAATEMQAFAAADALEPARAAWPRLEALVRRLDSELGQADVLAREDPEGMPP